MSATVLLNCGIGSWYNKGSERLRASLLQHGFKDDILIWHSWPEIDFPRKPVYNCKAAALQQAMNAGYTTLIWADSSITARKDVAPFLAHIREHGYWIGQSGHNAAQTASDAQLQYFGVSRDWAANVHECATGLFGFDVSRPEYRKVVEEWIQAARDGAFKGSRHHAGQSSDPRFLFARQDQSAMSLILGKHGIPLKPFLNFARFAWDSQDTVFHCQGM